MRHDGVMSVAIRGGLAGRKGAGWSLTCVPIVQLRDGLIIKTA